MYQYHTDFLLPESDRDIFVFGSNLAGIHGAGSAKVARDKFGAILGVGSGLCGRSYAIPTKDNNIHTLQLEVIERYVRLFKEFANRHKGLDFWITRVGCGLAGYSDSQIAPLFVDSPLNCNFPSEWRRYLGKLIKLRGF